MDARFDEFRANMPTVMPTDIPKGLNLDPKLVVKPFGNLDAPLIALGSYPTISTTSHSHYGILHDMTSPTMSNWFAKLQLHTASAKNSVLMADVFSNRLDRNDFPHAKDDSLEWIKLRRLLLPQLVQYHEQHEFSLWQDSKVSIGILLGEGT